VYAALRDIIVLCSSPKFAHHAAVPADGESGMAAPPDDRRHLHALRAHIDALLGKGASLVGRAPVRLSIDGQTLVVQHGMLVSEHNPHELIETLANIEWPTEQQRNQALELCLHHLTQALEETETTLRRWELEDDLSS